MEREIEESNNACKRGAKLDLIPAKDPHKGNELYLTSSSNLIAASGTRSWKTYKSRSKNWRLSSEASAIKGIMRGYLMTPTTLRVTLKNRLIVAVYVDRVIDIMKPWDAVTILPIGISMGTIMQFWMPCAER